MLLCFLSAWVYTEVNEYLKRDVFTKEVTDFMHRGDRFTSEDGKKLSERITILEQTEQTEE